MPTQSTPRHLLLHPPHAYRIASCWYVRSIPANQDSCITDHRTSGEQKIGIGKKEVGDRSLSPLSLLYTVRGVGEALGGAFLSWAPEFIHPRHRSQPGSLTEMVGGGGGGRGMDGRECVAVGRRKRERGDALLLLLLLLPSSFRRAERVLEEGEEETPKSVFRT